MLELFPVAPGRGELRKAEIVRAAIKCIATVGIELTTFEAIGKALGIRKSHVAYHFGDKTKIIELAIQYITSVAQKTTVSHLKKAETPVEQVLAIARATFEWAARYPEQVSVMTLFLYYASFSREHKVLHHRIRDAGVNRLAAVLRDYREPLALAKQIQAIITGNIVQAWCTVTSKAERAEIEKQTYKLLKHILNTSK